jgi:hypothetical protein
MKIGEHIRQGDVLLRKVADIPEGARELKRDQHRAHVVAYGERTGHMHRFTERNVCAFTKLEGNEVEFLLVNGGSGATLRHELASGTKAEHDPITLPDGAYECAAQVEYTPAELVRVRD